MIGGAINIGRHYIPLGSAAGDPMFYEDVALLPAILVFSTVIGLYKLLTYLTGKVEKIEIFMEGEPINLSSILKNG